MTYQEWIDKNYPDGGYGKCAHAATTMTQLFPELILVRGHYHCPIWGRRQHWWCMTEDGLIVDPTAGQFPSKGIGEYEPWNEEEPEPTGECLYCGEYVYNDHYLCSCIHLIHYKNVIRYD